MKIKSIVLAGLAGVGSALATYTPNYTASDMPSIVSDNLGEAGVQVKVYMPLIILFAVASGLIGTFAVIRARMR